MKQDHSVITHTTGEFMCTITTIVVALIKLLYKVIVAGSLFIQKNNKIINILISNHQLIKTFKSILESEK